MPAPLGQHFLKDTRALARIAATLELRPDDTVIEVGAGHGELTERVRSQGSRVKVIGIEKDRTLAEALKQKFAGDAGIDIVEGDALKEIPRIVLGLGEQRYKIAGNIPYYLTGKLLHIIGELEHKPAVCVFTVQKEVAERMVAQPPRMNRLAASVQFWATPRIILSVPRRAFSPAPEVNSAVVKLASQGRGSHGTETAYAAYDRALRLLFAQPRKTIENNLRAGLGKGTAATERAKAILAAVGLTPTLRPQDLSIHDIARVGNKMERHQLTTHLPA